MTTLVKQAVEHWTYVAPLLEMPEDEQVYDRLVQFLDELLELIGDQDDHPLTGLASRMGDLIEAYDNAHPSYASGYRRRGAALPDAGAWAEPEQSARDRRTVRRVCHPERKAGDQRPPG